VGKDTLGASTIDKGECLKSRIRSGITEGLAVELVKQLLEGSTVTAGEATTPSGKNGDV
jgi:hypothetical protein